MKLDGWIEIFRAGSYPGHRPFTAAEVDAIAKAYDPQFHEAPVVVGHPKTNEPAFGWVEKLESARGVLRAKFKQVTPEFAEMVERGLFKKRSAAFYPDLEGRGLYLRHVGFLGAEPPAVKGLSPAFEEDGDAGGDVVEIEYEEATSNMDLEKLKAMIDERLTAFAEAFGLKKKPAGEKPEDQQFAEAVKAAKAELKAETEAQFNEVREENKRLRDELAAQRKEAQASGALAFVEKATTAGRLTPATAAIVTALAGLLAGRSETVEFGEGDAKANKTAIELLQQLVDGLPKAVEFGELTAGQGGNRKGKLVVFNEDGKHEAEGHELAEKAAAIAAEKQIDHGEALKLARAAG